MYTNYGNTTVSATYPEAFITKGKLRLKQFDKNVYLNDGEEYEIELFNPMSEVVLASIYIDGDDIGSGGIVLRPGERVFIERFLDKPQKFQFRTYEVEMNNRTMQAIKDNGEIVIHFFREEKKNPYKNPYNYFPSIWKTDWNIPIHTDWQSIDWYNDDYDINTGIYFGSTEINHTTDATAANYSSTMDTGRTERGNFSDQRFTKTDYDFEIFPFHTVSWKILPETEKRFSTKDLNKVYCVECGARKRRSSFKFCPHCGTRF